MNSNDNPPDLWSDDLLERRKVAAYLTKYLNDRYQHRPKEKGFVLALTAEWGFGKTYLIEKWAADLRTKGHPVVSFDAWANDFTPEPLVAFVSQVEKSLRPIVAEVPLALRHLDEAIKKAKVLWRPTGNVLLQIAAKKLTNFTIDEIEELINAPEDSPSGNQSSSSETDEGKDKKAAMAEIAESLKKVYDSSLKEHSDKQSAISAFRESLALLVNQISEATDFHLPLFIFVDELDRCRPDYAIELLEGIKHLFGVPGVYFIIALNLSQLGESTKTVYGSSFAGHRYLKRFFDIEFSLPEPEQKLFAQSLFQNSSIPVNGNFFTGFNENNSVANDTPANLPDLFSMYARFFGLGLRDQQQTLRVIEAVCVGRSELHAHWLYFLAMLAQENPSTFVRITKSQGTFSHTEFSRELDQVQKNHVVFNTYNFDDPYSGNGKTTKTPLKDVIWVYYQYVWKNLADIDARQNRLDFPGNIIPTISDEVPRTIQRNKHYPSHLAAYPDLIAYAGHFR